MPFTFSHPAIMLFLKKLSPRIFYFPVAIISSMAPDFEYFIRLRPISSISHSLVGVFVFDLPIAILVWLLWEKLLKRVIIPHLPKPFDKNFSGHVKSRYQLNSLRSITILIFSALIGILSHLLWDLFTHNSNALRTYLPRLLDTINISGYSISYFHLLQQISTVIGLLIVIIALLIYKSESYQKLISKIAKIFFWSLTALITLLSMLILLPIRLNFPAPLGLASLSVLGITSFFLGLLVSCLLFSRRYQITS